MIWRKEFLRTSIAMTLNNTYVLELPKQGVLGSLLFKISGAAVSGLGLSGGSWRILDFISKVEVVGNSTEIIKSFTGEQLQALSVLDEGHMPPGAWRNYATNTQYEYFLINFGRALYDTLMGLDLSKWDVVELKITNTATAASNFTDLTVTIVGCFAWGANVASPLGYIRSEQWKAWTTVADETKYNDLPTEHMLRRIWLFAKPSVDANNIEQTGMANVMDDIDFTLRSGEIRLYKGTLEMLMRENYYELPADPIVVGNEDVTADKGFPISLGYVMGGAWGAGSENGAGAATIPTLEGSRTSFTQKGETREADHPISFIFKGVAPYNAAWFNFDNGDDPANWLDPEASKFVKLNIHTRNTAASAGGSAAIVLERLVRG